MSDPLHLVNRHHADLSADECWELLRSVPVGWIGFMVSGQVHIYPVNFTAHDGNLYFRTSPYGIVGKAIRHQSVAFEIDHIDAETQTGWSVLVRGTATWLADAKRIESLGEARPATPWADGNRTMHIQITPTFVSGRQIDGPSHESGSDS